MLRKWQQFFVNNSTKYLKEGGKIVAINSPTGSGKTLTALKIAEWALQEGLVEKVFFAVRTLPQELAPLRDIERFGIQIAAVPLVGKEQACPLGSSSVNLCPHCSWKDKLAEKPSSWTNLFEWINTSIRSFKCPYITLRKLAKETEMVILTYAYLSPDILPKSGLSLEDALLIVDEAHNVFNFMREKKLKLMWAIGTLLQFPKFLRSLKEKSEEVEELRSLSPTVQTLITVLKSIRKYQGIRNTIRVKELVEGIPKEIEFVSKLLDKILPKLAVEGEPIVELGVRIKEVLDSILLISSGQARPYFDGENLYVKEVKPWLKDYAKIVRGMVLMSGTLPSREYLESILSQGVLYLDLYSNDEVRKEYFKVFNPDNLRVVVISDYSSKYKLRTDPIMISRRKKVERACANIIQKTGGIGMLVYPSYNALSLAKPHLEELSDTIKVIIGERGMGAHIVNVARGSGRTLLAVVAGDQITEGVEITDENGRSLVKLVAIIGAPYPSPSPFLEDFAKTIDPEKPKEALERVFEEEMIVRVKQAMGRLIRHPDDKGLVVLSDNRFLKYLKKLAPYNPTVVMSASEFLEATN